MSLSRRTKLLLLAAVVVLIPINVLAILRLREKYDPQPGTEAGADGGFTEDVARARELARSSGRPLLMVFTGSDWCPNCRMLDSLIFRSAEWRAFAARRLVQLMIDFPRKKQLPAPRTEENAALAKQHGVVSYPVMLLFTPEGQKISEVAKNLEPAHLIADVTRLIQP